MKVAIATDGVEVSPHFGRCATYTIAEIKNNQIISKEVIANPGHEPGFLPMFLAQRGVGYVIAGGMGPRAKTLFAQHGIEVITGAYGRVDSVLQGFLEGTLEVGTDTCEH
ncbi:MAG: NifB/NifX family molybdenum-iron cluster-binding protein [Actinomycetota bacterium]|nr:NifB/NifX family molybdenum-iron cluster-binding protein [Actinomycetota bacterium]MDI6821755.1 NifB/NifX family molybdenum-iron cluster-binding protein [Actinomycetota bacterium]